MVVPLVSKVVKPKGHQVANFEKTVAQVSFSSIEWMPFFTLIYPQALDGDAER